MRKIYKFGGRSVCCVLTRGMACLVCLFNLTFSGVYCAEKAESAENAFSEIRADRFLVNDVYAVSDNVNKGAVGVSAESAVLIEASGGEVIFAENAARKMPMASTTKIMTALVAIESGDLEREISVSSEAVGVEGSSVYLYAGEKLSLIDLLYALMLESANDAAAAIAVEVGGSVEEFSALMNEKAAELGLSDTHFTNPHGLYDREHYTTALDLARLTVYALENPTFRTIVSTYRRVIPLKGNEGSRVLINHNRLLKQYEGTIGVKTGYTKVSGRCLVSAAERGGVRLVSVTLNAPDDWNDHKNMFDYGFSHYERVRLASAGELTYSLPVLNGMLGTVIAENGGDIFATLKKEEHNFTHTVELNRFYYAPIAKNEQIGKVMFYDNGVFIGEAPLNAMFGVSLQSKEQSGLFDRLFKIFDTDGI